MLDDRFSSFVIEKSTTDFWLRNSLPHTTIIAVTIVIAWTIVITIEALISLLLKAA